MIRTATAIAALSVAGLASAGSSHTFDISGLSVDGGFGLNFPTLTHDFGFAGTVTGVSWDVNFEAFSPSWTSEAAVAIDTTDDGSLDADFLSGDFGAGNAPGSFAYAGSIGANSVSSDGLVFLTLYDTFDDAGVDHAYGQGSTVTVTYIPAPAGMATLAGAGLLAARRRRA